MAIIVVLLEIDGNLGQRCCMVSQMRVELDPQLLKRRVLVLLAEGQLMIMGRVSGLRQVSQPWQRHELLFVACMGHLIK
jgi:hypothetical protein